MKGKIFAALAIAVVAVIAIGPVNAGCEGNDKAFGLAFGDNGNWDVFFQGPHLVGGQPVAADATDLVSIIGRHWQPGAFATTSNFPNCPDDWWLFPPTGAGTYTIFGDNGSDIGSGGACTTAVCPNGALILVLQTKSTDGKSASYVAGRVLELTLFPTFDYAREGANWNMVDIPRPRVTVPVTGVGGSRGANIQVDLPTSAFHSPAADALTANGTITGYQLVSFTGAADPGRDATANWTNVAGGLLTTSSPSGSVTLDCTSLSKVFLATRVVFDNGAVSSDYVSASTVVNCSNLATPGAGKGKPIKKSLGN
jgi:hypothetical protein